MSSCWLSVAALVAAGCRFTGDAAAIDAAGDEATSDGATIDAPRDGAAPFCDPTDPDLVACYQFQGNTFDASQYANHAVAQTVAYAPGPNTLALLSNAVSDVHIAESASLDITQLTIELWLRVDSLPIGTARVGVLDTEQQYSLFVYADGIECFPVSTDATMPFVIVRAGTLAVASWTHIACTYDGVTLILYQDGVERGRQIGTGPIRSIGTTGMQLVGNNPSGDRLIGAIDELRIWRVARSAGQICPTGC